MSGLETSDESMSIPHLLIHAHVLDQLGMCSLDVLEGCRVLVSAVASSWIWDQHCLRTQNSRGMVAGLARSPLFLDHQSKTEEKELVVKDCDLGMISLLSLLDSWLGYNTYQLVYTRNSLPIR